MAVFEIGCKDEEKSGPAKWRSLSWVRLDSQVTDDMIQMQTFRVQTGSNRERRNVYESAQSGRYGNEPVWSAEPWLGACLFDEG